MKFSTAAGQAIYDAAAGEITHLLSRGNNVSIMPRAKDFAPPNAAMNLSEYGECCVKLWEEGSLTPKLVAYNDGTGTWTISWGCTEGVYKGMTITAAEAEAMYQREIAKHVAIVRNALKRVVEQFEFDALVSFTFNEGYRPTIFAAANGGDYKNAVPKIMLQYNKAKNPRTGKLETWEGLVDRRANEIRLWHGVYTDARIPIARPYQLADNDGSAYYAADPKQKPSRVTVGAATGTVATAATSALSLVSTATSPPEIGPIGDTAHAVATHAAPAAQRLAEAAPKIDAALGQAEQGLALGHRLQDVSGQLNEFGMFLLGNPSWLILLVIAVGAVCFLPKGSST